jgi:hypothetical protein
MRRRLVYAALVYALFVAVTAVGLIISIFCTQVLDWPYYGVSAPVGYKTQAGSRLLRWGLDEVWHLPFDDGVELSSSTSCHPREADGTQICHFSLDLVGPVGTEVLVNAAEIIIHDAVTGLRIDGERHEIRIGVADGMEGRRLAIDLDWTSPPRAFLVELPPIFVSGEEHAMPVLRFDQVEIHQCIPFFMNY